VLLSREPLTDVEVVDLPFGAGPQQRSALTALAAGPGGEPVRVTSVHLQHRDANTPTRLDQLAALGAALPDDGPAVLAGDLNAGGCHRTPEGQATNPTKTIDADPDGQGKRPRMPVPNTARVLVLSTKKQQTWIKRAADQPSLGPASN